jgi:hypothetical protein
MKSRTHPQLHKSTATPSYLSPRVISGATYVGVPQIVFSISPVCVVSQCAQAPTFLQNIASTNIPAKHSKRSWQQTFEFRNTWGQIGAEAKISDFAHESIALAPATSLGGMTRHQTQTETTRANKSNRVHQGKDTVDCTRRTFSGLRSLCDTPCLCKKSTPAGPAPIPHPSPSRHQSRRRAWAVCTKILRCSSKGRGNARGSEAQEGVDVDACLRERTREDVGHKNTCELLWQRPFCHAVVVQLCRHSH